MRLFRTQVGNNPTPPPKLGVTQDPFLKRCLKEFSSSRKSCCTKFKLPSLSYYLPIAGFIVVLFYGISTSNGHLMPAEFLKINWWYFIFLMIFLVDFLWKKIFYKYFFKHTFFFLNTFCSNIYDKYFLTYFL